MKKYDLHIHTYNSVCSNLKPDAILKKAKELGLDGIAITDHKTIRGALEVAKANTDPNFEVIVGEEIPTEKGEVLGLYLKKEIKPGKFEYVVGQIHKQGGIAVMAHPYSSIGISRKTAVLDDIVIGKLDAIEGFNARSMFKFENTKAQRKAKQAKKPMTAGSDAHFAFEIGRAYTEFEGDLRQALKQGTTKLHGTILYSIPGRLCTTVQKYVIHPLRRFFK